MIATTWLLVLAWASASSAQGTWCEWDPETLIAPTPGRLYCYPDAACSSDLCGGTDDPIGARRCVDGACMPPCTTIRLCANDGDCLGGSCTRLDGTAPAITWTDGMPRTVLGVCTEATGTGRFPPPLPPAVDGWGRWADAHLQSHTIVGLAARIRTASWAFGDADGDTCANAVDASPFAGPREPCPAVAPSPPASCGPPAPTTCCTLEAGVVGCEEPLRGGACGCSTVRRCSPGPVVFDASACPPLFDGGEVGACVRTRQTDVYGLCLYPEFFASCTEGAELPSDCLRDPTGSPTSSFFEGDCDRDGCPNGHDPAPCDRCDGLRCENATRDLRPECQSEAPDLPLDPRDCAPDADRVDAATVGGDGGDAVMDAGSPREPARFGGSGCRCEVSAREPGPGWRLALLLWPLTFAARRLRASRRPHTHHARTRFGR
jgi:hypothetical protein